jgi:hypothetical protein
MIVIIYLAKRQNFHLRPFKSSEPIQRIKREFVAVEYMTGYWTNRNMYFMHGPYYAIIKNAPRLTGIDTLDMIGIVLCLAEEVLLRSVSN